MVRASNIHPLSEFVRNARQHIQDLRETGEPEVLTVNGEAAVVVLDAKAFDELTALAAQAKADTRLREALEFFREGGEGTPVEDVFEKLERRYFSAGG